MARAPMSYGEAAAIADEQIAWWIAIGVGPDTAWRALGLPWAWAVRWSEVRGQMIRHLMRDGMATAETLRLAA